jgi:hypothetical protein
MKTGVSVQSVCIVLNHALDNELKEKCLDFIFRHPQQVIETGGFLELHQQHLTTLIGDDKFNVRNDLHLSFTNLYSIKPKRTSLITSLTTRFWFCKFTLIF